MTSEECYKMTSVPRGVCVVIDNVNETPPRKNKLVETFQGLHFTVETHSRLTRGEILGVMKRLSERDHTEYDCVVVFVSAHGDDDVVCGVDNCDVTMNEMTSYLKPEACPTLAGKPKLFFVEACRGDEAQYPIKVKDAPDAVGFPATHFPNEADFFFGFSTVRSFVSYKDCFKTLVAQTLSERASSDHLLDIMTEVNRKMALAPHMTGSGALVHQVSEMTSRLRRKLFFNQ